MKKIITLLFILISLKSFAQKVESDWHWDYCNDFEGPDAVRLKITLHYLWYFMDPPDNTMDMEYDNIFSNAQECSKYFQREFAEYPFDRKDDVRVDIDIHYHCAPCAAHNKKKKEDESKKKYSIGSRKHNRKVAESAKSCFNDNEDSYNDFLNSLGNVADNVYLDELTCKNGKLFPVWSKHDSNGKQIPLTDNDRKTVDDFYKDMQGKSKAREINKLAQQLIRAQTVKEANELMNTLKDLFISNPENTMSSQNSKPATNISDMLEAKEVFSTEEDSKTGTKTLYLDTNNDGFIDTKVTKKNSEPPIYQSYDGGLLSPPLDDEKEFLDQLEELALKEYNDKDVNRSSVYWHYKRGNGEDYFVNTANLDLSMISEKDFPNGVGSQETIPLFQKAPTSIVGNVFGDLRFEYLGNNEVKVVDYFPKDSKSLGNKQYYDTFNCNVRTAEGITERNVATQICSWLIDFPYLYYKGQPFKFYFHGTGHIGK